MPDPPGVAAPEAARSQVFPVAVFLLTFGLLLSDFMSRQVLSAVLPFLKDEWALSDTQLGGLSSIVALTVGLLAFPLSLAGDRWGRSTSIVVMATAWSVATLGSALASGYQQMMVARLFIGLGEAAYGSVGLAVALAVFPPGRRASLTGAFMAGGPFGSVLGVFLGGVLAVHLGWRGAFAVMGLVGLALVVVYALVVSDRKLLRERHPDNVGPASGATRAPLRTLVSTPAVLCAYVGSGLQLFVAGTLLAWLPSFLNRAYGWAPDLAAVAASVLILVMGLGMVGCGVLSDALSEALSMRRWSTAVAYAALSLVLLGTAFLQEPGGTQLVLLAVGVFFAAGTSGPAGGIVASLTPESIRATAFGTFTSVNNVLGLAAGPFVIGLLADRTGLVDAMRVAPLVSVVAIAVLLAGRRTYASSLATAELVGAR